MREVSVTLKMAVTVSLRFVNVLAFSAPHKLDRRITYVFAVFVCVCVCVYMCVCVCVCV